MEAEYKRNGCPAIRQVMFPRHTNPDGDIWGGVLLGCMDTAAAVAARRVCSHRMVTVFFNKTEFKKHVEVGDILTCWAEVTAIGNTSINIHIWVDVERKGQIIEATEGDAVFVAIDANRKPISVASGLIDESWRDKIGKKPQVKTTEPEQCSTCSSCQGASTRKKTAKKSKKKKKAKKN